MKEALKEAQKAFAEDEVPVGAVIVHKGKIIARAHNLTERLNDATAHAEMLAMTSATNAFGGKYLNDCVLYVTVEPCPMCASALNWTQMGQIIYGTEDPKRGYSGFVPSLLHPKTEVISGIMRDECSELMKKFFKKIR